MGAKVCRADDEECDELVTACRADDACTHCWYNSSSKYTLHEPLANSLPTARNHDEPQADRADLPPLHAPSLSETPLLEDTGECPDDISLGHRLRAASVHYLSTIFLQETMDAGLPRNARMQQVEESLILKKSATVRCPRDGKLGAAFVDCIHGWDNVGIAQLMLSHSCYSSKHGVGDIADTLLAFCAEKNNAALLVKDTNVWMCCLCVNQHRRAARRSAGEYCAATEFHKDFAYLLETLGQVVVMVDPMEGTNGSARSWCAFEFYAEEIKNQKMSLHIPMTPQGKQQILAYLQQEGIDNLGEILAAVRMQSMHWSERRARLSERHKEAFASDASDLQESRCLSVLLKETCYEDGGTEAKCVAINTRLSSRTESLQEPEPEHRTGDEVVQRAGNDELVKLRSPDPSPTGEEFSLVELARRSQKALGREQMDCPYDLTGFPAEHEAKRAATKYAPRGISPGSIVSAHPVQWKTLHGRFAQDQHDGILEHILQFASVAGNLSCAPEVNCVNCTNCRGRRLHLNADNAAVVEDMWVNAYR